MPWIQLMEHTGGETAWVGTTGVGRWIESNEPTAMRFILHTCCRLVVLPLRGLVLHMVSCEL